MIVFASVVQLKSFAAAADQLAMSRSAISKHVTRLERALGVRLLNRTTRRLGLTEAGHAVYEHCARLSSEAEASAVVASLFAGAPRGVLRVSVPGAFGRMHLVPLLPEFLRRHPALTVELVMGDRHVDLVSERFDVAITSEPMNRNNLVVCRIAPIRWIVCATALYLRQHGTPHTLADLERHNCIFFSSPVSPGGPWRFRHGADEHAVSVKGNFRVNNSEAVREAALRDLGLALLPTFAVATDVRAGRLLPVLGDYIPVGTFGADLLAHYVAGRLVPPNVRAFIDYLLENFRGEPYWDRVSGSVEASCGAAPGS